jgi:hypothetical protein
MSTTLAAVILAVAGVVCVLIVSWVFYRIGKAEDRDRKESGSRARPQPEPEPEPGDAPPAGNGQRTPGLADRRRRPRPPRRPG